MTDIKYPDVYVVLTEESDNVYSIMGIISNALRKHGVRELEIQEFYAAAMAGDYDHFLAVCNMWVTIL